MPSTSPDNFFDAVELSQIMARTRVGLQDAEPTRVENGVQHRWPVVVHGVEVEVRHPPTIPIDSRSSSLARSSRLRAYVGGRSKRLGEGTYGDGRREPPRLLGGRSVHRDGVVDYQWMGIQVELRLAGRRVQALPDPAGGSFDAAGDFNRLVPSGDAALALLSEVDRHGETCLGPGQMEPLIAEIDLLLEQARPGSEYRGLTRLRVMALRCARDRGELIFIGD